MGFFLEEAPLPTYILDIVDHHGQRNFCYSPSIMQPSVFQAFYEGRVDNEEDTMIVYGCEIPFNAQEINVIFQLRDDLNTEGNQLIATTSHEHMQDAVQLMAKPGSKWETSPTGIKTLPSKCLLLEANLWVYFVKKRLITTNDATVSRDRIMAHPCLQSSR